MNRIYNFILFEHEKYVIMIFQLPKVLPALNANQPHHNMNNPTTALVGLPIGGSPSISHLPNRAPMVFAATKAVIRDKQLIYLWNQKT